MAGDNINRGIFLYINEQDVTDSLNRLQKQADNFEKKMTGIPDKTSPEFLKLEQQLQKTNGKIADLGKKLAGEITPSLNQMQAAIRKATNELNNMPIGSPEWKKKLDDIGRMKAEFKGVEGQIRETSGSMQQFGKANEGLMGKIFGGVALAQLAKQGLNLLKEFFTGAIEEAAGAEESIYRLKLALENMGEVDALPKLTQQAEELAATFRYLDNDDILAAQEKLVTYGKLTTEGIQQLTPVIIDYAAKTRKGLAEATEDIIKGLEGQGKALKTMGIELEKGGTAAQNYGVIMDQLKTRVEGSAAAFNENFGGTAGGFKQGIKDLQENLGNALLPVLTDFIGKMNGAIKAVKDFFNPAEAAAESFKKQAQSTRELEGNINPLLDRYDELKAKTKLTKAEQDEMRSIIEKVGQTVPIAATGFDEYGKALDINSGKAREWITTQKDVLKVLNADAIKEYEKELKRTDDLIKVLTININRGYKVEAVSAFSETVNQVAYTNEELVKMNEALAEAQSRKSGIRGILEDLQGAGSLGSAGNQPKGINAFVNERGRIDADAAKKAAEEYAKLLADIKALQQEFALSQMSADDAEIARLKAKFDAIKDRAKGHNKELLAIQELYLKELEALENKQFANAAEREYAAAQKTAEAYYEGLKLKAKARYADTGDEDVYRMTIESLDLQLLNARKQNAEDYKATSKAAAEDVAKYDAQYQNAILDKRIAVNNAITASSDAATAKQIENADKVKQAEMEAMEARLQVLNAVGAAVNGSISGIFELQNQYDSLTLARDKKVNEEKKAELDKQLKHKSISEEKYRAQVAKLDQEYAEKERKLKKEAFVRDKAAKVIQSIINTALAVTNALANGGIAAPALAAIAGVTGALQTALIAGQPVPEYEQGGVLDGPSHRSKGRGLHIVNPETGKLVALAEGREWIVNKRSSSKHNSLLDAINRDDSAGILNFAINRPGVNFKMIMEAMGKTGGNYVHVNGFDDSNLLSGFSQMHRLQVEGAKYIVKGLAEELKGGRRKL